jgi:hypothetical protein
MTEKEQHQVAWDQWGQHETFRRRCYEKLQRIKNFLTGFDKEEIAMLNSFNKEMDANSHKS